MGKVKIVRVREASFVGDDGKEISGRYIYVVPEDGGSAPRRLFLSDNRLLDIEYVPAMGDVVYLFEGRMGAIVDILKA